MTAPFAEDGTKTSDRGLSLWDEAPAVFESKAGSGFR